MGATAAGSLGASKGGAAAIGVLLIALGLTAGSWAAGERFFGTHPLFVAATALSVVASLVVAGRGGAHWPAFRRSVLVLATLQAAYLALWAGAAWLLAETGESVATRVVYLAAASGHIPVIARAALLPLDCAAYFTPARAEWARRTITWLSVAYAALGTLYFGGFGPFSGFGPLVEGTFADISAMSLLADVVNNAALLSTVLPAFVAVRAARQDPGERRRHLSIIATASLVPVALVQFCTLTGVAADVGGASEEGTLVLLFTGFALAIPAAAAGNALALRTPLGVDGPTLARAGTMLLTALAALTAIPVGVVLAETGGGLTGLWAAAGAVAVMVVLQPVQGRLARALSAEPCVQMVGVQAEATPERPVPPAERAFAGQLTPREHEVLELLADGLSNAGIAERLVVSERTVDAHVRSIFAKLDLPAEGHVNRRVYAAMVWRRQQSVA